MILLLALAGGAPLQAQPVRSGAEEASSEYPGSVIDLIPSQGAISGPYDPALMEHLGGRGRELQEAGDYRAALQYFRHLLHVTRVNQGLYTDSQFGIIEEMIKSESALHDWTAVDRHYALMEHLYLRIYDPADKRLEEGLQQIASWYRYAANANVGGNRIDHLIRLNRLLKLRLRIAESTLNAGDPALESLNRNIALNERELYGASGLRGNRQWRRQEGRRNEVEQRNRR